MKKNLQKLITILRYLLLRYTEQGFSYRAAFLAYITILSIVPFTIFAFSLLSYFPIFKMAGIEIQQFVIANFVAESAHVISQYLDNFIQNVHKLSKINIVFLLLLDILMLYNIHETFNMVWHTKTRWHLSLSFLIYFIVLMLSPIVLGGVLVLGSFVYKMPYIELLIAVPFIKKPLIFVIPYAITFFTFTIINWILPSYPVKFRHALLGGLITTIIFELAKSVFAFYMINFSAYRELYGTLAIFPLFLVWLYVSWLIILLGALVTHLIAKGIPNYWLQKLNK